MGFSQQVTEITEIIIALFIRRMWISDLWSSYQLWLVAGKIREEF